MENTANNRKYILCVVRSLFGDLGFICRHEWVDYYGYALEDNRGSVDMDSVSVYYYINGHIGFIYPENWDESSKDKVLDDIKAHLYGPEFWHFKNN